MNKSIAILSEFLLEVKIHIYKKHQKKIVQDNVIYRIWKIHNIQTVQLEVTT